MGTVYMEEPYNWNAIQPYVRTDRREFVEEVLARRKCFFYDTCSYRRHAGIGEAYAESLLSYLKGQDTMVVLIRCVLMELASQSGILEQEYVEYCRRITWAVRMLRSPASTITRVLEEDRGLRDEVVKGRNRDRGGLYDDFFTKVRGNKEPQDNLGEELLAVCLHILSRLPGEADGKFCVVTDDKGAAYRIDELFGRTPRAFRGNRIILFSTPKLVQTLYEGTLIGDRCAVQAWLRAGTVGNITVLGTRDYDLRSHEISLSCEELAGLIMEKEIHITF